MTYFMREKPDEEYMEAILTYHLSEGDSISKQIKLKSRGNFRREMCMLPPIRLNLKDAGTGYSDLDSFKKLKLVTHCNPNSAYQVYILKEYLIYKLYNLFTEYSFRTRLLKVNYIDTGKKGKIYTRYGFVIEPVDMIEERLNAIELENLSITNKDINPENADRVCIFQYMVGNTDWHFTAQHNIKIFKPYDINTAMIIPYDFDFCGLVKANYANPRDDLTIQDVTVRIYLGYCREEERYIEALEEFGELREEIMSTVQQYPYLEDKEKNRVVKYLNKFFELHDKGSLPSMFRRTCMEQE